MGRVIANRKRSRDAYRTLGEALEIAIQRDDDNVQAAVHMVIGELRRQEGNSVGAVASFSAALQHLPSGRAEALALAKASVELASTLAQGPDQKAASEALVRAQELSIEARAPYLEARALAALVALRQRQGDRAAAYACLEQAWEAAAKAGDAETAQNHAEALALHATSERPRAVAGTA